MLATIAQLALGGVLLAGAGTKLAAPRRTRAALATFGLGDRRARAVAWGALLALEAGLGAAVALGADAAAWAAAGLMLAFAAALAGALRAGRGGQPCGCLGPRSRVSRAAVLRNLALAGAYAALPFVPARTPGAQGWLAIGLALALAAIAVLAVLVLGLAREVGELRLALGPQPGAGDRGRGAAARRARRGGRALRAGAGRALRARGLLLRRLPDVPGA